MTERSFPRKKPATSRSVVKFFTDVFIALLPLDVLLGAGLDVLGLEPLEGVDLDIGHERVQLVGRVLVLVAEAGQADADAERDVPGKRNKEY